jgi:hypothetical protein
VEVRPPGMVRELQWSKRKLPKVLWWCGEDWRGVAHSEQKGAEDGGDGGGGARGSGQSKSRNGNGMGREVSSAALEPEEMRREGGARAMPRRRRGGGGRAAGRRGARARGPGRGS